MAKYNTTHRDIDIQKGHNDMDVQGRDARLKGINWHNATAQEQHILQRVEGTLKAQPWWPQQATAIPQPVGRRWQELARGPLAWAGAMCICLLMGSFAWGIFGQRHTPNAKRLVPVTPRPIAMQRAIVPLDKERSWTRPQRWQLRAAGATHLEWRESSPRHVVFRLKRGRIAVHVTPGSMKQFEVRWAGTSRLIVKGTRFTVERRGQWLRLEVQRGAVAVQRGQHTLLIGAGQGIRLMQQTNESTRYTLPTTAPKGLTQQLSWLRQQQAHIACQAAFDWSERPGLSKIQRKDLLEHTAYILQPKGAFRCITRLWLNIHKLHISAASDETALAAAAQSCRQRKHKTQCVGLYRQYLRSFPKGMLREHVMFWLLRDLSQQTTRQRKEALQLLNRYKRHYPKGQYKRSIKQLQRQMAQ